MEILRTHNLCKTFYRKSGFRQVLGLAAREEVQALKGIHIGLQEGEIFGLLGPNGSGKTTLIKILCNLVLPTQGTATVYGHDLLADTQKIRKVIGLVNNDERSFYWRLTGRQNLEFYAALYQLPVRESRPWIEKLLEIVDLQKEADITFHYYSTGMKQKLAIVRGLLHQPKILFMDEPTRSLDPISARSICEFISGPLMNLIGGSVIVATHDLEEAESLCHRVAVMHRGSVVAEGSSEQLRSLFHRFCEYRVEVNKVSRRLIEKIRRTAGVLNLEEDKASVSGIGLDLRLSSMNATLAKVLEIIMAEGSLITECYQKKTSLENIFHSIIKKADERV